MSVFLVAATLMLAIALAFVLVPLLIPRSSSMVPPLAIVDSNVAIFRQQRQDILREFQNGLLTAAERDDALAELVQRAGQEMAPGEKSGMATVAKKDTSAKTASKQENKHLRGKKPAAPATPSRRPWAWVAAVVVLMPLLAIGLYSKLGSPDAAKLAAAGTPESPAFSDKQILAMVDSLAEKLKSNPNDAQGWALLARSQNALGRWAEAGAAFDRANQLAPNNAQLLADYADVSAMAQGGSLEGKPFDLVQQALKSDGENKKALALAGTAELNRRNFNAALEYWMRLQKLLPAGSDDHREVGAALEEIRLAVGSAGQRPGGTSQSAGTKLGSNAPGPPAQGTGKKPAGDVLSVTGNVTISPELARQVSLTDTLFIFARAANWQQGGPRMPLAVLRVQAKELPRAFALTDGMAMAPNVKISDFPEVVIEARISKSGAAVAQPGDLQGLSATVKPGATGVSLVIDRIVK